MGKQPDANLVNVGSSVYIRTRTGCLSECIQSAGPIGVQKHPPPPPPTNIGKSCDAAEIRLG